MDWWIQYVVSEAMEYGNKGPLIESIRRGDPELFKDETARELLAKIVEGKSWRGSGKRGQTRRKKEQRDRDALLCMYYWRGRGLTVDDACEKVAEEFGLSPESIRDHLWKGHEGSELYKELKIGCEAFKERGRNHNQQKWGGMK